MTRREAINFFFENPDKKLRMIKNCNGNKVNKIYSVVDDFVVNDCGTNLGVCVVDDQTEFELIAD